MKILVISDSHGEKDNILEVSKIAKEENVSKVIHLGDDYDDTDFLVEEGIGIEKVPGVFSAYYTENDISNRKVIEIEGWKFLLTHTKEKHEKDLPGDVSPENMVKTGQADIVLYGHTHIPTIAKEGNVYLINPGHLKAEDNKGYQPSYAMLNIEKDKIDVVLKRLNTKEILMRETITKLK